jgi:hypothetical protein
MNPRYKYLQWLLYMFIAVPCVLVSCSKDNPNKLPSVSPSDYAGKIEGFDSSAQIAPDHLIAYWNFDGNEKEMISGAVPTATVNDSYVDNGVTGQGLSLNSGYLYYASQLPKFDTSLKSFTVSEWVQVLNNGSTPTLTFTIARPGQFWGNINFLLETGQHPASDLTDLVVHPDFSAIGGGTQDNLNASYLPSYKSPTLADGKWNHLVITYDRSTSIFQIWADGVMIGAPDYQNRGTAYFNNFEPNEVLIGGWYNNIPGKEVSGDTWTVPMVGKIDEIRVYNTALGAADIKALYELGAAGK